MPPIFPREPDVHSLDTGDKGDAPALQQADTQKDYGFKHRELFSAMLLPQIPQSGQPPDLRYPGFKLFALLFRRIRKQ